MGDDSPCSRSPQKPGCRCGGDVCVSYHAGQLHCLVLTALGGTKDDVVRLGTAVLSPPPLVPTHILPFIFRLHFLNGMAIFIPSRILFGGQGWGCLGIRDEVGSQI